MKKLAECVLEAIGITATAIAFSYVISQCSIQRTYREFQQYTRDIGYNLQNPEESRESLKAFIRMKCKSR